MLCRQADFYFLLVVYLIVIGGHLVHLGLCNFPFGSPKVQRNVLHDLILRQVNFQMFVLLLPLKSRLLASNDAPSVRKVRRLKPMFFSLRCLKKLLYMYAG